MECRKHDFHATGNPASEARRRCDLLFYPIFQFHIFRTSQPVIMALIWIPQSYLVCYNGDMFGIHLTLRCVYVLVQMTCTHIHASMRFEMTEL
jgi:hypothetical protein